MKHFGPIDALRNPPLVYKQTGDKAKASESLQQAREILLRLTKLSPDNMQRKIDLAKLQGQSKELVEKPQRRSASKE